MNLVWKLLRQHISIPQFVGFFFANLWHAHRVVRLSVLSRRDACFHLRDLSSMKSDYIIVNKKIGMGNTISGRTNTFSPAEVNDVRISPLPPAWAPSPPRNTRWKPTWGSTVSACSTLNSSSRASPTIFVDAPKGSWKYTPGDHVVPIILPRPISRCTTSAFAQSRSLPKDQLRLVGMINFDIFIHGNGHSDHFKGKVIGFSSRLNTILVPQAFMDWSNNYFAPGSHSDPTRLIMQVDNPANEKVTKYIDQKGYEVEDDKLQAEKTTYFLRMIVSMVMVVGLVISILSFYILMLSIYLLVQKNSSKLENLLLIGYSPNNVARPYQLLTIGLNTGVLLIAWATLYFVRDYYMGVIETLFPDIDSGTMLPAILLGLCIFALVSICNIIAIRHKIVSIWKRKE